MATTSNTYTGNGSNKLFSITFPYLDTSDIDVYLNGTLQTIITQYTFANATTVEFVAAPANGATVKLDRSTDDSDVAATFFPGSSIKAADLNENFDQTLYVVQEINNNAVKLADPLYANKTYIDAQDATKVNKSGDSMSGALAMGTNKITGLGNPTNAQDAATKTYVDAADALKVTKSGDSMSGVLAMGTNKITGLGNPTNTQDAATKTYVDAADALKVNKSGDTMSGNLAMAGNRITGLGNPTSAQDATTKTYTDSADALKVAKAGDTMSGSLAMGGNKVTGLGTTSASTDAATKQYVDDNALLYSGSPGFTQDGTGAVTRSWSSKLKDTVSVKDFGAVGNGIADDTAAIQAAFTSVPNGGTITFPFATYRITDSINIAASDISIIGNDSIIDATDMTVLPQRGEGVFRFVRPSTDVTTTLASTAVAGAVQITVASSTGMAVGDLIRCISNKTQYRNSTAIANYNDQNIIKAISGNIITLEHSLAYDLNITSNTVSITAVEPIQNLKVSGLKFLGAGEYFTNPGGTGGASQMGLYFLGCRNITVSDCSFTGIQGASIWCEYANNVDISHCYFEGYNQSVVPDAFTAFYAVFVVRGRNARVTQCACLRIRHMCDSAEWYDFLQANNVAQSTHLSAFGAHEETYNLIVANNISYNCYAGAVIRSLTSIITGNTFYGGPLTVAGISTMVMNVADPEQAELIITDNRIEDNNGNAIILNLATDYLQIANNYLKGAITIYDGSYDNVSIKNNTIHGAINFTEETSRPTKGLFIQSNTFTRFGSGVTPITIRGCTSVVDPSDCIMIADNLTYNSTGDNANGAIILRSGGYYGDSIIIKNNTQWGDISAEIVIQSGTNLKSWPVVEQNENDTSFSSRRPRPIWTATSNAPTELANATVLKNSIIMNSNVAAAGPQSWQVTSPGTYGTIAGVTGTIGSGQVNVTLTGNDATKVYPGCIISIAGSGLTRVRVLSITSNFITATLESPAITTATNGAVARAAPVLSAVNLV